MNESKIEKHLKKTDGLGSGHLCSDPPVREHPYGLSEPCAAGRDQ